MAFDIVKWVNDLKTAIENCNNILKDKEVKRSLKKLKDFNKWIQEIEF